MVPPLAYESGILQFGTQEWLKREWRRNNPHTGGFVEVAKEFSLIASLMLEKGVEGLLKREMNSCLSTGDNF